MLFCKSKYSEKLGGMKKKERKSSNIHVTTYHGEGGRKGVKNWQRVGVEELHLENNFSVLNCVQTGFHAALIYVYVLILLCTRI